MSLRRPRILVDLSFSPFSGLFFILLLPLLLGCSEQDYYQGKWKKVGEDDCYLNNCIDVKFDSTSVWTIQSNKISVEVDFEVRNDELYVYYKDAYDMGRGGLNIFSNNEFSRSTPIAILRRISDKDRAIVLDWKGFNRKGDGMRYTEYTFGNHLQGVYKPEGKGGSLDDMRLNLNSNEQPIMYSSVFETKFGLGDSRKRVEESMGRPYMSSRVNGNIQVVYEGGGGDAIQVTYDDGLAVRVVSEVGGGSEDRVKSLVYSLGGREINVGREFERVGVEKHAVRIDKTNIVLSESGSLLEKEVSVSTEAPF